MSDKPILDSTDNPLPDNMGAVDRKESPTSRLKGKISYRNIALIGGGFLLLYLIGTGAFSNPSEIQKISADKEVVEITGKETDPLSQKLNTEAIDPTDGTVLTEGEGEQVPSLSDEQQLAAEQSPEMNEAEKRRLQRQAEIDAMRRSPVIVMAAGDQAAPLKLAQNISRRDNISAASSSQQEKTDLEQSLKASKINRVKGGLIPNRHFTIEAGAQIPCVLQNAMDSSLSGLVTCVVPQDVRSATGQVILLDKGTRIIGEYRGGLEQGQARLFVVWNRAVTPEGVSMKLASPATDALGRTGLDGDVENFFWKRFGAALLLSIITDVGSGLGNSLSGANQTFRTPGNAASDALQKDQDIKPVLRAPQGQQLNVMAAHDLDFSNIYSLRLKRR